MFKKISLILFVLSAIVTADPVDLALVNENENDIEIAQDIEQALLNPNISNASEVEKAKLRDEFTKALCLKLKKTLDMTIHDKIEKRGLNRAQINHVIDVLVNEKKTDKNYYNFRNVYSIKKIDGVNYLYENLDNQRNANKNKDKAKTKKSPSNPNTGRIVALEEMFDVCLKIHIDTGYQGRDTMLAEADKFYGNITRPIVVLFLNYSTEYQLKRVNIKNNCIIAKPIKSTHFNQRWQIDLIDFRTCPDGEYNWIITVQDHFTKFVWLRPLRQKSGLEVARALLEIFGEFGAPFILQSDNGREFRNQIVTGLKTIWPKIKIIHGRPRRPQSQGSVERCNGDVQNILGSWMRENLSTKWAQALPIVANIKNRKYHSGKFFYDLPRHFV